MRMTLYWPGWLHLGLALNFFFVPPFYYDISAEGRFGIVNKIELRLI
jgi:hypothetical protein